MSSIQEQLALKKGKNVNKLTSGFDVDTKFVSDTVNEAAFLPKKIAYSELQVSPFNTYEFNDEEVEELKDSILKLGMLDYIIVEPANNKFEILSGQKRFLAITKIKEENPDSFILLFPDEKIPCRIVDFTKFKLVGTSDESDLSVDAKRTFVIAAGNQQHEKTVRDYMLQIEQLSIVYTEMKAKGIVAGQRQREFIADHTNIQSRSSQKVINAKKNMVPELWEALKTCKELNSITQLEELSKLPENEQKRIAKAIKAGKKDALKPKKNELIKEPKNMFWSSLSMTPEELEEVFSVSKLQKTANSVNPNIAMDSLDIDKLNEIGAKIEKLRTKADKIISKYNKQTKKKTK